MSEPGSTLLFEGVPRRIRRRPLSSFAARLTREVAGGRPFTCLVTRDAELQRLNREFLGNDNPTDVLSFPSVAPEAHLGDIAISVDLAQHQARQYGHGLEQELSILMLHGLLHLLGMDHETDGGQMRRSEAAWRRRLRLPPGLLQRRRG